MTLAGPQKKDVIKCVLPQKMESEFHLLLRILVDTLQASLVLRHIPPTIARPLKTDASASV